MSSETADLTTEQKLDTARRYRLAALAISNPDVRQSYLDRAAELEAAAAPDVVPIPDEDPLAARYYDQATITTNPALRQRFLDLAADFGYTLPDDIPHTIEAAIAHTGAPGALPYSIRIHSQLAQIIVSGKEFTRSYGLWATLRAAGGPGWLWKSEVIELAMEKTGKAESTIYNWLAIGEEIFWTSSGGRMWLAGKDRVFNHFLGEGVQPGKVILVPTELILNHRLHVVRANLSSTWITNKNGSQRAARETRYKDIQGIPARTQYDYDHTSDSIIKPLSIITQEGNKQGSSRYFRPTTFYTLDIDTPDRNQFFAYRPAEFNAAVNTQTSVAGNGSDNKIGGRRVYFNDQSKAVKVAEYRKAEGITIPVIWVHPDDQFKKTFGTADMGTLL